MLPEAFRAPLYELFSVCVAVAALETLVRDERAASCYRILCALAATVCALRALLPFFR